MRKITVENSEETRAEWRNEKDYRSENNETTRIQLHKHNDWDEWRFCDQTDDQEMLRGLSRKQSLQRGTETLYADNSMIQRKSWKNESRELIVHVGVDGQFVTQILREFRQLLEFTITLIFIEEGAADDSLSQENKTYILKRMLSLACKYMAYGIPLRSGSSSNPDIAVMGMTHRNRKFWPDVLLDMVWHMVLNLMMPIWLGELYRHLWQLTLNL